MGEEGHKGDGTQNGGESENNKIGDEPRVIKGAVPQAHDLHSFLDSLFLLSDDSADHSEVRKN